MAPEPANARTCAHANRAPGSNDAWSVAESKITASSAPVVVNAAEITTGGTSTVPRSRSMSHEGIVGDALGRFVGEALGRFVGEALGLPVVGQDVGFPGAGEGAGVGRGVGRPVGEGVGNSDGTAVVGIGVGCAEGDTDARVGASEGMGSRARMPS